MEFAVVTSLMAVLAATAAPGAAAGVGQSHRRLSLIWADRQVSMHTAAPQIQYHYQP